MNVLVARNIVSVHHFTPLHYLWFIAQSKKLMCKPSLQAAGFPSDHFRSTSRAHDVARGFGGYTHLTPDPFPKILKAKLAAGFPHVGIVVPTSAFEGSSYSLCRFNVAMTRNLRRNRNPGHPESRRNGRYYCSHQIPIARTIEEKTAMLDECMPARIMIEVLVHGDLPLPDTTQIVCYSDYAFKLAKCVLESAGSTWPLQIADPATEYPRNSEHAQSVEDYLKQAMSNPAWRGNGLEFDRL